MGTMLLPEASEVVATDRRRHLRFPLVCDMTYRVLASTTQPSAGRGRTLNVSSQGLLFRTERPPELGDVVEVVVNWPVVQKGHQLSRLIATGKVVRRRDQSVAVAIECREFRGRRSAAGSH